MTTKDSKGLTLDVWEIDRGEDGILVTTRDEDADDYRDRGCSVVRRSDKILPIGTRVRMTGHPEITGAIQRYEWQAPGALSTIPYRIDWDDDDAARKIGGWFWIYATPNSVEAA